MASRIRSRPARNGSGGSTLELLIALTVLAAGTLTTLALRSSRSDSATRDAADRDGGDRDDR